MENKLIEDEFNYEEINGVNGLKYKLQNSNTKVSEDPIIKKWLSSEKLSKGDNGIPCYCIKCNLFFYFRNKKELNETKKECCESFEYGYICNYCGEIFFSFSLCCSKNGIKYAFKEFFTDIKFKEFSEYLILFPIMTYIIFFFIIYEALFDNRRLKVGKNEFSSYNITKLTKLKKIAQIIIGLLFLLNSLIYAIPFLILYLILLVIIITHVYSKDKKQL